MQLNDLPAPPDSLNCRLPQYLEKTLGQSAPFRVRAKENVVPAKIDKLLDILPQLPHPYDGILILCGSAPSHLAADVTFPLPLGHRVVWCPPSGETLDTLKAFVTQ
jgi:hypothetical protein